MCGICGMVRPDENAEADPAAVRAMSDALVHRGPDDAGLWHEGPAALAMRRLSVIDIAGGRQPMLSADGSVVGVFNGEIYNFREIRSELEAAGIRFRTRSDTEVLVEAWAALGNACLDRLNGMFACALYHREQKRLFLARDRLGEKPLFYAETPGGLFFASELDALMRPGLVPAEIDPAALDAYLEFLYVSAPDTIYKGVRKLLPGSWLEYQNGQKRSGRYWEPSFAPGPPVSLGDAAAQYRSLLEDAVRLRTVSDVPLGALLSGGIDSSSVTAVLAGISTQPVKTFTIGFGDPRYDETARARATALRLGTDHTEAILDPDIAPLLSGLIRHFGEPFADSSFLPTWLVSRVARGQVTVALSGDGGDELFAGYDWTRMTLHARAFGRVPALLRTLVATALRLAPDRPATARLGRFLDDAARDPREVFRRRHTAFTPGARADLYQPALARAVAGSAVDRFAAWADEAPVGDFGNAMLFHDTRMYLPGDILAKVDRMSMANSLEVRPPLLDHRIVEFAAGLPFSMKLGGGVTKRVVREAVRGLVLPEVFAGRKQGFALPVHRWFREDLGRHFEDTVLQPDARIARLLRPGVIRDLFETHRTGRENHGHRLFALLMLEHWLQSAPREIVLT